MSKSPLFHPTESTLRQLLAVQGPQPMESLMRGLQASQPTVSRGLAQLGDQVVRIGRARQARYALRRAIADLEGPISLYQVGEDAQVRLFGHLIPIEPGGFYFSCSVESKLNSIYRNIPYFLEDLRPAGFLGRLLPGQHPELGFPKDIREWSERDCLRYWTQHGWNLLGNWIVGETALQLFLQRQSVRVGVGGSDAGTGEAAFSKTSSSFSQRAQQVLLQGEAGSSAGGEQPKFLVEASETRPAAIVKFSPAGSDAVAVRIRDLLFCEELALRMLRAAGRSASEARVVEEGGQVFLESIRFDRVGCFGRKAVLSAQCLSLEFVGNLSSWSAIAQGLLKEKKISQAIFERVVWIDCFGELIANGDRHAGNLAFWMDGQLRVLDVAPAYDCLPMAYFPRQSQVFTPGYAPVLPTPERTVVWLECAELALQFWRHVASDRRISEGFRAVCRGNAEVLGRLQAQVQVWVGR